ncbi:PRC-barrel domain protein [Roseivivax jejudonensis]|uniref:PRC-barrel domain protein n=1 Tax=Roseivivax jejudonensis TaxID=1529041 RepID=A0A1X6Z7Q8_9RHOB|nr:PRC-barrel domain-containing protein [Roseivivax jejudonensis]SLN43389.1 PRC-barrel domain protein [Roseivivax jejudonensis]
MKHLLTTTAALLVAATPAAFADQHNSEQNAASDGGSMQDTQNAATNSQDGSDMSDTDMASDSGSGSDAQGQMIRASDITGAEIYTTNEAQDEGWDPDFTYDAVGGDWNQIGTISDVVFDTSGNLSGFVAEIGGFLDIGDKDILIQLDDVNLVESDDYAFVTRLNEEDLESMDSFTQDYMN